MPDELTRALGSARGGEQHASVGPGTPGPADPRPKRGPPDLAAADLDHLARVMKRKLKRIQYRPELIDGYLTKTGPIKSAG